MKLLQATLFLVILNFCLSLRPVSGAIVNEQTRKSVQGAKVYNKVKTYEATQSDSSGHFYFLSVRSLLAINPISRT